MKTKGIESTQQATSHLKLSGCIHPDDTRHHIKESVTGDHVIAPSYVNIPGVGSVAQYAPTVFGTSIAYDPANDCQGYYMSYKFQPNNNCYAYGTVICSNSFPQPGRMNGYLLPSGFTGADVVHGATLDGLQDVGATLEALKDHATTATAPGHYVALMISPADPANGWPGDYHWARCDDNTTFQSWSQKDGSDQVTNFDFAGNPITNPATANWTVNQGPIGNGNAGDLIVSYEFYTFMYVPAAGVNII